MRRHEGRRILKGWLVGTGIWALLLTVIVTLMGYNPIVVIVNPAALAVTVSSFLASIISFFIIERLIYHV